MPELPTPDEILNTGGNNLPSPELILGDEAKKKIPTGPLVGTGALIAAPRKGQSKLDQLLLQGKSFIYTPGSEEDLASEDALENQTKDLLSTRLNNGYKSLISLPETPRSELPQGLKETALYPETQKQLNKLTKKFELTESESSSFANPLVRLSSKPMNPVPSDLKGVEFWDNEYAAANKPNVNEQTGEVSKKGFQTYPYNREDGLLFDKTTLAPVVLKKIMDDYANFIQKTQPNKYKLLSYLDKGSIPFTEARSLLTDNKKLGEMMTPYIDADRATKAMEEGKDVPVNQMSQVERYNIMMEALNHQSVILNQDYEDMKVEGITDADQKYARGRKALEDLSKNILQSFPDMAKDVEDIKKIQQAKTDKQNAADRFYQGYIDRGGFWADPDLGLRMNLVQPIAQSIQDFASGWLTLPRDIGLANSIPALQEIVKIGDAVGSDENLPELATPLKESVVPQIVKGVSDMSLLLLGTKGLGSALAVGYKPAMFANSFAITHDNYYQEAKDAGMTDSQASEHAARSAALTSALEFISPNKGIVNGFKASITPSVVNMLSKGATIKDAFNAGAKDLLKEVGAENAQEITQLIGDKASNYYTNQLLGKSSLDTKIRTDEILNTILVTSAVTGLVAAPMIRNKSSLQRDFMYTAATNPYLAETAINSAVDTEQIDKKQAEVLRKKLTDYKSVIDGLPTNIPGATKSKLADLVYQKKLLAEQKKDTYVDPVFKNVKEAEQLQAEQEIDNEINQTINDTQKQIGLPSVLGEGETNVQAGDVEKTSSKEIETNRILQAQEPSIDEARPDEAMDAYVNRMVEEHKADGDIVGPVETAFAEKFYTKKWMDKFSAKTQPIEQPSVLTEQQIEQQPYGENEAANAFERRTQNDVNESEAAIQALESEAKDVEHSQDRARASQVYGAAGELIEQPVHDFRAKNGYTVQNKKGELTVLNKDGQPVKSQKVRQAALRNYKKTLRVFNDSGTLRVVDETGAEVTGPEFTENLIQKYKESFPYDQGRTSVEVAETGDPVELSENPMELAAIGTPEAAVKFKQLTGITMEEYVASQEAKERKLFTDTALDALDQLDAFLKDPSKGGLNALPIPLQLLRPVVKAIKLAVKAGRPIEQAIREGRKVLDALLTERNDPSITEATNKAFDAMFQDISSIRGKIERAKKKGTEQVYKFGLAEGKLAGEIRGMAEGRKEGAKEQRALDREERKKQIPYKNAKASRKSIKRKVNAKDPRIKSVFANDKAVLKDFLKINPLDVSNIEEYNDITNRIKESISNPSVDSEGNIRKGGRTISNKEIEDYTKKESNFINAIKAIEPIDPVDADVQALLSGTENNQLNEEQLVDKEAVIRDMVTKKMNDVINQLDTKEEGARPSEDFSPLETQVWNDLKKIDPSRLTLNELISLNNILDNISTNESLSGAGQVSVFADAQARENEIVKTFNEDVKLGNIKGTGLNAIRNDVYPISQMIRRVAITNNNDAKLQSLLGITEVFGANDKVGKKMEVILDGYDKLIDSMPKEVRSKINDVKERNRRGMYSRLYRNSGGTPEEIKNDFLRVKGLINENIEKLLVHPDPDEKALGQLQREIYNEMDVEFAQQASDLKIDPYNKSIIDYWVKQGAEVRDPLFEHTELYNDYLPIADNNYTSIAYRTSGELDDTSIADIKEDQFGKDQMYVKGSRTTMATVKNARLPKGKLMNLDFDNVQSRKLREALYQLETQKPRLLFDAITNRPEVIKTIGAENIKELKRGLTSSVKAQMRVAEESRAIKEVNKVLNRLSARGIRISLQGLLQPIKQGPSVWVGYSIRNPKDAFTVLSHPSETVNQNLFKYGTILSRRGMQAGYQRQQPLSDISKSEMKKTVQQIVKASGLPALKENVLDKVTDAMMEPLVWTDNKIAKKTWMGYYKQYRLKQGVENFSWDEEAANPNLEASAYAEGMIDNTQNVSEFSKISRGLRERDTMGGLVKNIAFPLSGFAINQRGRIGTDIQKIRKSYGTSAEGWQGLGATMAEVVTFNALKIWVLAYFGKELLEGIKNVLGIGGEEEEDKLKAQKLVAQSLTDFTLGGFGSLVETFAKANINEIYKKVSEEKSNILPMYNPENEWIDWSSLGMYGTVPQAVMEGSEDFYRWWTGKMSAEKAKFGGKENVTVDLTPQQQSAFFWFGLYELMKLNGLSGQTLNSAMRKAQSRVERQATGTLYEKKEDSGHHRTRRKRGVERKRRNRR